MTTFQWLVLDHAVALLATIAWFGAGAAAALGRARTAIALGLLGLLLTASRWITVALLASRGWWFVQEKVLLGVPLATLTAVVATAVVGRASTVGRVAALFTAGYAALAGLAVTLVSGYPLEWSTALIALGGWGAASLLTFRIVARAAVTGGGADGGVEKVDGGGRERVSRRRLVSVAGAVAVTASLGTGLGLTARSGAGVVTGGGPGPRGGGTISVTDLRGATVPARGGEVVRHVLTAQKAAAELESGPNLADAWTYNGQLPGPALVATQGDLLEVILRNTDIDEGVTLHWHGYDVPCAEDGAPGTTQLAVAPGEEFTYRFLADQTGTYWYHTHQTSHIGVRRGLYGTLVVHPRVQPVTVPGLDLTLPLHTFDGILFVGDRSGPTEHTVAAGAPVRLRLLNTDSEPHELALVGATFRVVAVDGRDLHRPDAVDKVRLRLPAGGRYDIVHDMPRTSAALVVDGDTAGRVLLNFEGGTRDELDLSDVEDWPELDLLHYGQPASTPLDPGKADRHFTIVLDRGVAMVDGAPTYAHTVNGRGHPSIPDQLVAEGDLVRFTVVNRSLETHPWHLHGHPVLVLSRDGTRSTGSPLWVDTFDVRPGEVWEVAFQATNPGIWMNHCHNLPHAHQGMMLRLAYDGVTPLEGGDHAD